MRQVLIVEDERDICECLQDFFQAKGFAVQCVFSGEEALERLERGSADVILLDILLPGVSGLEVLMRARTLHPKARIIMVTALDETDLRLKAHRYGADAYITKPFNFYESSWSVAFH